MSTYYVDPAASGSNNGSSWTNAWTSIATPLTATTVAGDIIYCRGTETRTNALGSITTSRGGSFASKIIFIGCDSSGTANAGQFVLQSIVGDLPTSLILLNNSYLRFENFTFDRASSNLVARTTGGAWIFKKCIFQNSGAYGIINAYFDSYFEQCVFQNNVGYGSGETWNSSFLACKFLHNGTSGLHTRSGVSINNCLFHGNAISGLVTVNNNSGSNTITNSVFDGHPIGYGIDFGNAGAGTFVFNSRFTNNKYGLKMNAGNMLHYENYNAFYNNTTSNKVTTYGGEQDILMSSDGYIDTTNHNFCLKNSAEGRRVALDLDWDL